MGYFKILPKGTFLRKAPNTEYVSWYHILFLPDGTAYGHEILTFTGTHILTNSIWRIVFSFFVKYAYHYQSTTNGCRLKVQLCLEKPHSIILILEKCNHTHFGQKKSNMALKVNSKELAVRCDWILTLIQPSGQLR